MHYYTFSVLIFANGMVREAHNCLYKSDNPATIIEFKKQVEHFLAGPPESYSGIVIPTWQEIDKATYNHIEENLKK